MSINKQADELNSIIKIINPGVYDLLSERGKAIFFPKNEILRQGEEAKNKKINATVGIAIDDEGQPMSMNSLTQTINIKSKDYLRYAPVYGIPELRRLWKSEILEKNPSLKCKTSTPIVTAGITHALNVVGSLFVDSGDKIILPDMFWENYRSIFSNCFGGVLDSFETFDDSSFNINGLEEKLEKTKGKKIVLLNFPNNPTGYTPTNEEAEKIISVLSSSAQKNKTVVICDDAYFGFVYKKGVFNESIFSKLANSNSNLLAIKVDGATKENYAWGLRIGFITYGCKGSKEVYASLEEKTVGAVRSTVSNPSNLSQKLIIESMKSSNYKKEKDENYNILKLRFLKLQEVLKDKKFAEYFQPLPHNSGYFMCVKLKEDLNSEDIRKRLLEKYETGVVSIGNVIRVAFSGIAQKNITELFENIYSACKDLST